VRTPKARGKPIDVDRMGSWLDRFDGYRVAVTDDRTRNWLRNFSTGLTGRQYDELFIHKADLLREGLGTDDSVAFFDDFAGTGQQACRAWRELAELLPGSPKTYLILIAAGQRAVDRIGDETGLRVVTGQVLGPSDDIFSQDCRHFPEPEKHRLLEYCRRADRKHPRGYGDCGFVIVLAHRTPNNSIPVIHANHGRWMGLFPRHWCNRKRKRWPRRSRTQHGSLSEVRDGRRPGGLTRHAADGASRRS